MELVSVIIPNYNNAKWLSTCLNSCLEQKGNFQLEIIVVDDHSTDESWKLLEEYQAQYPSQVFLYQNPSKGGNAARNYGFSKSTGDYIQWLDADDALLADKFQQQLSIFHRYPETDLVYSDWRMDTYQHGKLKSSEVAKNKSPNDFLAALLKNKWQANSAYLMKRETAASLFKIGLWSLDTKIGQDREYFTMAAILGARFRYAAGCFSVYNRWSDQTVSTKYSFKEQYILTLELNQRFFKSLKDAQLKRKERYRSILNAELLNALFYFPLIKLPRLFFPWQVNIEHWHWKKKLAFPLLYFWHLFRAF